MTEQQNAPVDAARDAAARVAELRANADALRDLIRQRIEDLRAETDLPTAEISRKLGELYSAHLKLVEQERAFHEKLGYDPDANATNYDVVRADIGRQLDRIRAAREAEGMAGGSE